MLGHFTRFGGTSITGIGTSDPNALQYCMAPSKQLWFMDSLQEP